MWYVDARIAAAFFGLLWMVTTVLLIIKTEKKLKLEEENKELRGELEEWKI